MAHVTLYQTQAQLLVQAVEHFKLSGHSIRAIHSPRSEAVQAKAPATLSVAAPPLDRPPARKTPPSPTVSQVIPPPVVSRYEAERVGDAWESF